MTTPSHEVKEQRAREQGYLAGRAECSATIHRLEAQITEQRRLMADAMSALVKEREYNESIDLWPDGLRVVGKTHHSWPKRDEHLFTKWRNNTGMPYPTQYRTCIHPNCTSTQYRNTPKG